MLGPAAGGTQLRVHGHSFEGGVASEYACRLGSAELGWQQVPAISPNISLYLPRSP